MHYSLLSAALITSVSAHGVVTMVNGANGVDMPGLSVADGTPRDCSSNRCGSQADTSIIRDREMSMGTALGYTQGNGPVDASVMIANFMGGGQNVDVPVNNGTDSAAGVEDDLSKLNGKRRTKRQLSRFLGGGNNNGGGGGLGSGLAGLFGGGANAGDKNDRGPETIVAASAGAGAQSGLPTADDDGVVTMTFRQINQDGAGPMTADIDGTSGGVDPAAFQTAEITQDIPGLGIQGLSLATNTDFTMQVKMPQGMTCDASVGGADNVCIVRVRNGAAAGPFGGSGAFTQTAAARKRAVTYRLKKRMSLNSRA